MKGVARFDWTAVEAANMETCAKADAAKRRAKKRQAKGATNASQKLVSVT